MFKASASYDRGYGATAFGLPCRRTPFVMTKCWLRFANALSFRAAFLDDASLLGCWNTSKLVRELDAMDEPGGLRA